MEEREKSVTIFRAEDDGEHKIKVLKAASLENEIRFYLNDTQYIKATDEGDKITIGLDEIQLKDNENKESLIEFIKNNKKDFLWILSSAVVCCIVFISSLSAISELTENYIILILWSMLSLFICIIAETGFLEYKIIAFSQKSKHSAEHMMANFLEKNSRLPKNFQEIKSASRFSKKCGSRFIVIVPIRYIIVNGFSILFSVIIEKIILTIIFRNLQSANNIVLFVMFIMIFSVMCFINLKIAIKGKYNFIINPIQQGLNYFLQCCNTTKKVKDKDIMLAFSAAKVWLQIVYPEFYSDNELYCEKNESENA